MIHGAPYRFSDPARFSYAHGGKDGHPFPVPLRVYDETIRVLKHAITRASLGNDERMRAIQRLDEQARRVERAADGPQWDAIVENERRMPPRWGGRTVAGPAKRRDPAQPELPGLED